MVPLTKDLTPEEHERAVELQRIAREATEKVIPVITELVVSTLVPAIYNSFLEELYKQNLMKNM